MFTALHVVHIVCLHCDEYGAPRALVWVVSRCRKSQCSIEKEVGRVCYVFPLVKEGLRVIGKEARAF